MDKEQILTKIQDCGIVAVVRAESTDKAIRITDLRSGGLQEAHAPLVDFLNGRKRNQGGL